VYTKKNGYSVMDEHRSAARQELGEGNDRHVEHSNAAVADARADAVWYIRAVDSDLAGPGAEASENVRERREAKAYGP
jgi:hypothetical protein